MTQFPPPEIPHFELVRAHAQPCIYGEDILEGLTINGPADIYDWEHATVVLKLPIHGTATVSVQEIEVSLGVFAALLEKASGWR